MILRISKCAHSIPGKISDRPRWSKNIFENCFKSKKITKEAERNIFRPQSGLTKDSLIESIRAAEGRCLFGVSLPLVGRVGRAAK